MVDIAGTVGAAVGSPVGVGSVIVVGRRWDCETAVLRSRAGSWRMRRRSVECPLLE